MISKEGEEGVKQFEEKVIEMNDEAKQPWMDGTFGSKAFGEMLRCVKQNDMFVEEGEEILYWCTKSLIQPIEEGIDLFEKLNNKEAKQWLKECGIENEEDLKLEEKVKFI